MAVVPENHPLASRNRIYWPDLRRERIVTTRQDPGIDLANLAIVRLSEPGLSSDVETRKISRENILNLVPVSGFVTLTSDGALGRSVPGVVLLEIHDLGGTATHVDYWGYWRSDNSSAVLARLLKLVSDRHPA